jgi:hypothetical protein
MDGLDRGLLRTSVSARRVEHIRSRYGFAIRAGSSSA